MTPYALPPAPPPHGRASTPSRRHTILPRNQHPRPHRPQRDDHQHLRSEIRARPPHLPAPPRPQRRGVLPNMANIHDQNRAPPLEHAADLRAPRPPPRPPPTIGERVHPHHRVPAATPTRQPPP